MVSVLGHRFGGGKTGVVELVAVLVPILFDAVTSTATLASASCGWSR
jgi:hypothetical protein